MKCAPNTRLQAEFEAGLHPNLLAYQKRQAGGTPLPALEKYLVGATSYLHQPSNYYDIFGAGRCVIIVQLLDAALEVLQAKQIKGLPRRVERLLRIVAPDEFDSTAFELITAARYALVAGVDRIEFIAEQPPNRTPDILLKRGGADSFVECKKVVRVRDFSVDTRNTVRESLNGVISSFRRQGASVLAEVAFNCDPKCVSPSGLFQACEAALNDRVPIVTSEFTVKATRLPKFESKDFTLHPSPHFSWVRYGYRIRGEWFGVVHQVFGKPARLANLPKHLQGGLSTWLDSVEWDAAIKWKITAEDVGGRYRRFAFDGLFAAIEQINSAGLDSTVHLWLETDYFIGGRREVLLDFFRRLSANVQHTVGWIVINETLLDVSPKGRFDLIEHAHMIQGPTATAPHPLVSGVFGLSSPTPTTEEFGVGNDLPDIDED
ncbi:MAG: hypothetical protein HYY23_15525 [Verrucomicrobia bacterium]|nr:hypothetical protein [Verrucomicrobiota bacterium]